jgi:hypothetical protein
MAGEPSDMLIPLADLQSFYVLVGRSPPVYLPIAT